MYKVINIQTQVLVLNMNQTILQHLQSNAEYLSNYERKLHFPKSDARHNDWRRFLMKTSHIKNRLRAVLIR